MHFPAGLGPVLGNASQTLTFFAPTNAAWAGLPPGIDVNNRTTLQSILLYNLVLGPVSLPAAVRA